MEMSRRSGNALTVARLQQLATTPPREFPKQARTVEALASLLEVPVATIVLSFASSLGLAVHGSSPILAVSLPPGTDNLTPEDRDAILAVTRQLVAARRHALPEVEPGTLPDLAHPEPPDVSLMAARKGESKGRHLRQVQDDDAES